MLRKLPNTNLEGLLAAIATIACAAMLAACGSSSSAGTGTGTAAKSTQTVRIALDYTANVNYLGIYAAIANGYFAQNAVNPQIIPYAETPAETLIQSGRTDLGISYPPEVLINRAKGLKYRAVAALVAGNTTALAVLSSSSITRPSQLSGKLYGGFGIASDKPIISSLIAADGATSPSWREVVLNSDVIQALASHRIDYTAVFGGIDDVTAELQGTKLRLFPYSRYLGGAGNFPNAVFVASDQTIASRAAAMKGALKALAEGYEWSAAHPQQAAQILIRENETALGKSQNIVYATANATATRFVGPSGKWGTLSDEAFAGLTKILAGGGLISGALPTASQVYTNALLPSG
jgi:ABC-type nitrate/sulfonate/bicarbonate transport system substrate-binding protein